jgi:hypothetical protein
MIKFDIVLLYQIYLTKSDIVIGFQNFGMDSKSDISDVTDISSFRSVSRALLTLGRILKNRRSRPDGGEWEPIKIPRVHLAYISKLTRHPYLLTRPRPYSYRKAIGP